VTVLIAVQYAPEHITFHLFHSKKMSNPQSSTLQRIKHVVMVLSGKGGVGKSTVACQMAMALAFRDGLRVGILDVDLCGPSVPKIVGVEGAGIVSGPNGWKPVVKDYVIGEGDSKQTFSLKVMSIAFLLPNQTDAVIWRGPRKDAMIKQFLQDVDWGELDYLIIDTPPGTSDEHMTLCEALAQSDPTGAVIVTTPQDVSTDDVKKELNFCYKLKVRCLGIVENMSGYVCPHCAECTAIFSKGGGEKLAAAYETPFLGAIPLDPMLSLCEDDGSFFLRQDAEHKSPAVTAIEDVVRKIQEQTLRVELLRQQSAAAAQDAPQ
jgi:Mrp family chromosome partitioning ATPase